MWMLLWGKADWKERKSIDMPVLFYFNDFVCVYIYVCAHVSAHACVCTYLWRPESISSVFLNHPPSTFLRQGFSLYLECIDLAELTDQWAPGIHLPPSSQLWVYRLDIMPSFYVGTGDLNSSPHTCTTGTLLTYLLSPWCSFLMTGHKDSLVLQMELVTTVHDLWSHFHIWNFISEFWRV